MPLHLANSFKFHDLYQPSRLKDLHQDFLSYFSSSKSTSSQSGEALIEMAVVLEEFLIKFFNLEKEFEQLIAKRKKFDEVFAARRDFVQRVVLKKHSSATVLPADFNAKKLLESLEISDQDPNEIEVKLAAQILANRNLEQIEQYCVWALFSKAGKNFHLGGALFILPAKINKQQLVPNFSDLENKNLNSSRFGFDLRDAGFGKNRLLAEAKYCLHCHRQQKDSCRTGLPAKSASTALINHEIQIPKNQIDELGVELAGCPLDEKISEMNFLASKGNVLAALSVAMIDNPLLAATGHRICNDCSKACIFQKQEPVDIPQIETGILKEILSLPFGFEIYSLLTRWNPLNSKNPFPTLPTGKKILVCGLGPAGFTLAHYLLNCGHQVVAIDGLKIEPLPARISGRDLDGKIVDFEPIEFLDEIYEPLSSRLIGGFGGVMEYGITSRFDKNFLKIIRLLLERRSNFSMFGGLRFGSAITEKIAFETYGFDHVALCLGTGRPNILKIKNAFASGVRLASDFLMSLQLTGAYQDALFSNLQLRLPVVVVGGGLTAIDTACEAIAYYATQIRKFAFRLQKIGKEAFFAKLSNQEREVAEEFLRDFNRLNQSEFAGNAYFISAKILYRGKMQDSPAYRLNHQELILAQKSGVEFVENADLEEILIDENGWVRALKTKDGREFACRSLLIAIGTSPNISPVLEDGLDFELDNRHFKAVDLQQFVDSKRLFERFESSSDGLIQQNQQFSAICKIDPKTKKAVSFFGDLHPKFEGNVVKAMASAKLGFNQINQVLELIGDAEGFESHDLFNKNAGYLSSNQTFQGSKLKNFRDFASDFLVKVHKIERLSPFVVEITIHAPLLARQTKIGQIFRLQNFHALARKKCDQILAMEGVAVTALSVDEASGLISGIVVETGGSTSLISEFRASEPCIFAGPSGKPTEIPKDEIVVLIGGGRGNQPLTALAEAFSANGCEVIFFAGYRKNQYPVRLERMRKSCQELIISISDEVAQEGFFQGSAIEAVKEYFGRNSRKINRVFVIGNDQLMHEVAKLRHQKLVPEFAAAKYAIVSLNASMQCMMKGVCSQCLQRKIDEKGEVSYFYACASQDQNADELDFEHLHARCAQNSLAEKTSRAWLRWVRGR